MSGEWSIAEFLHDVLEVSRAIMLELSVEERMRLKSPEGEDVFVAVVSGGCYGFAVLVLAVYLVGAVVVPLCKLGVFLLICMIGSRKFE